MIEPTDSLAVALEVIDAFESMEIPYHVGGSWASSIHGVPRQTFDIDIVADLSITHVPGMMDRLQPRFYVDADAVRNAIETHSSFNVIHLRSGFKVDVFTLGESDFDRVEFERRQEQQILEDPPRRVFVKSPEDIVLRKLQWFDMGGGVSDRQWTDAVGVLKVQAERLDLRHLRRWAEHLDITDLLERAILAATTS
jgi:hypothetical protein